MYVTAGLIQWFSENKNISLGFSCIQSPHSRYSSSHPDLKVDQKT